MDIREVLNQPLNKTLKQYNKELYKDAINTFKREYIANRCTGDALKLEKAFSKLAGSISTTLTHADAEIASLLMDFISTYKKYGEINDNVHDMFDKFEFDVKRVFRNNIENTRKNIDKSEFDFNELLSIQDIGWSTVSQIYLNIDSHTLVDYQYMRAYLEYRVLKEQAENQRKFWFKETEIIETLKTYVFTSATELNYEIDEVKSLLDNTISRIFHDKKVLTHLPLISQQNGENVYASSHYYNSFYSMFNFINDKIKSTEPIFDKSNDISILEKAITDVEEELGYHFTVQQKEAIYGACQNSVFTLTGLAGTGKSTSVKAIIRVFENLGVDASDILGTSFTGQATYNLRQSVDLKTNQSSTIHRWLAQNRLYKSSQQQDDGETYEMPLPKYDKVKLIVIDEFSMVQLNLINQLLNFVKDNTDVNILFVGDLAQLPSINVGFAYDFVKSEISQQIELTQIVRQSEDSLIPEMANTVRIGEMNHSLIDSEKRNKNFRFISRNGYDESISTAIKAYKAYTVKFPNNRKDLQIITNTNNYVLSINRGIQKDLIKNTDIVKKDKFFYKNEDTKLHSGDRIILTKNIIVAKSDDFEDLEFISLFNGSKGYIKDIEYKPFSSDFNVDDVQKIIIEFDDFGEMTFEENEEILMNLSLAYATTVHKSQGSTHKDVIMVIGRAVMLNSQQLLYTALTRTSDTLTLISSPNTIKETVNVDVYSKARCIYKDIIKELNQNTYD